MGGGDTAGATRSLRKKSREVGSGRSLDWREEEEGSRNRQEGLPPGLRIAQKGSRIGRDKGGAAAEKWGRKERDPRGALSMVQKKRGRIV